MPEKREKTRERRLTGDLLDPQKLAQHRIRSQPADMSQPLRAAQNPCNETEGHLVGPLRGSPSAARRRLGFALWQHPREQLPEAVPAQESAEGRDTGPSADFLIRKADSDRLRPRRNLNKILGHCLVSLVARVLVVELLIPQAHPLSDHFSILHGYGLGDHSSPDLIAGASLTLRVIFA